MQVIESIAALKGISTKELSLITYDNTMRMLNIKESNHQCRFRGSQYFDFMERFTEEENSTIVKLNTVYKSIINDVSSE